MGQKHLDPSVIEKLQKKLRAAHPDVAIEACKEILRTHYRNSLFHTCKDLLGYSDMTPHTHGGMCQALESPTRRKLIVMPRGCFKSSVGVVGYSIWRLMRDPNERILIDSEVFSNSKNFLREMKGHFSSPRFKALFGDLQGSNWNESEMTITTRTKAYKEASITAGGIGTVKVGQHYSVIIGDDLNSGNNSETQEGRRKVVQHYRMGVAILEPQGTYVIIGTRYADNDLIGTILAGEAKAV